MEPIKIKIMKRSHMDEESEIKMPPKKRIREKVEKENKNSDPKNSSSTSEKSYKILRNSPVPNTRSCAKIFDINNTSSDDEIDSVFDEMLIQLNKSGIKVKDFCTKSSTNNAERKNESSSKKKKLSRTCSLDPKQTKSKKDLSKEFEKMNSYARNENNKSSSEKVVCELKKLSEDLILNYKRIPKMRMDLQFSETSLTEESIVTLRRSSRRKSSILNEMMLLDSETTSVHKKGAETPDKQRTPINKFQRTPNRTPKKKSSSVKKLEVTEPQTPTNKMKEQTPTTPLEKARVSLHVSTIPESLPCREKEYNNIFTFLENKLWDGIGGCMYISGVPGTGKTATVTQVIRRLQELSKKGKIPEFKYIEINGMRLSNPRQTYVQLWEKLFDKKDKITPDRAQRLLDDWFSKNDKKKAKKTTVLLVDELDLICTKKQDVVYNLLDWPTRTHSRFVVLTIANTMDMPERLFKGRVTSRMGLTRLTFMPYTHKQLEEIVLARLEGHNAFVTDAVRLVTRKVAAVSGDARRALDICRRATELPPPDETVKISHIEQAIKEMTNSNIAKVIRNCGDMERRFLLSLSDVSSRSNVDEVDLLDVVDQLFAVCVLEGISRPSISSLLSISNRLKCCRLIFSNQSNAGVLQRLTLNVTQDDIHYALRT